MAIFPPAYMSVWLSPSYLLINLLLRIIFSCSLTMYSKSSTFCKYPIFTLMNDKRKLWDWIFFLHSYYGKIHPNFVQFIFSNLNIYIICFIFGHLVEVAWFKMMCCTLPRNARGTWREEFGKIVGTGPAILYQQHSALPSKPGLRIRYFKFGRNRIHFESPDLKFF